VVVAILSVDEGVFNALAKVNAEPWISSILGHGGYQWLGVAFFAFMAWILFKIGNRK